MSRTIYTFYRPHLHGYQLILSLQSEGVKGVTGSRVATRLCSLFVVSKNMSQVGRPKVFN